MNVISQVRAAVSPKPYERPSFVQVMPIELADLELLGTDPGGLRWFRYPKAKQWGDLRERRGHFDTRPNTPLPDLPAFLELVDGEQMWTTLECHRPGSWEQAKLGPVRRPKPPEQVRPVDLLGLAALADKRPQRIVAIPSPTSTEVGFVAAALGSKTGPAPIVKPSEPEARGPERILARLKRAGATVRLAADGEHLVVSSERGTPGPGVVELVGLADRLLVGHLSGSPVMCELTTAHKKPEPAVTIVLGGAAACADCLATADKR